MHVRVIMLASVLLGFTALGTSYRLAPANVALAQVGDADLIATIEALQTQVAQQDQRITGLEEDVALLMAADASSLSATPQGDESQNATVETKSITGAIHLTSYGETAPTENNFLYPAFGPGDCIGWQGYDDLTPGAGVVIMDGSGSVVATGRLGPGTYDEEVNSCDFTFTVEDVPTSDFYSIRIGHRDGPTYSFEELEEVNWTMDLSIGD